MAQTPTDSNYINNESQGAPGLDAFFNPATGATPAQQSGGLDVFFQQPQQPKAPGKTLDPSTVASIAASEGLTPTQTKVLAALLGQESSNGANAVTSIDGARGAGQIMPATFKQYARAGESIDNPQHNLAVMARIVKDLGARTGDDPAKIAAGYFSGPGNIGTDTPYKQDRADSNGKRVSSYVTDVLARLTGANSAQAAEAPQPQAKQDPLANAPKWTAVVAKPEYQAMNDADKAGARQAYFNTFIAPTVPAGQLDTYRQWFDQQAAKVEPKGPGLLDKTLDIGRNLTSSVLKIGPTALKGIADIGRLVSGDTVGKDTSDLMERGMKAIDEVIASKKFNEQNAGFRKVMQDPNKHVGDMFAYLIDNPAILVDNGITTVGSMLLPMGVGAGAVKITGAASPALRAATGTAATIGTSAVQNAADTFSADGVENKPLADRYKAASVSAAVSILAGIATGGGAEGEVARRMAGDLTAGRIGLDTVKQYLKAIGKEAGQEAGEEIGNAAGESVGSGVTQGGNNLTKRIAFAGTLGGIMGGGTHALVGHEGEQAPAQEQPTAEQPRVEPAMDGAPAAPATAAPATEAEAPQTAPATPRQATPQVTDQDVLDYADTRRAQLLAARDGEPQYDVDGKEIGTTAARSLTEAENAELTALDQHAGDAKALAALYGFNQPQEAAAHVPEPAQVPEESPAAQGAQATQEAAQPDVTPRDAAIAEYKQAAHAGDEIAAQDAERKLEEARVKEHADQVAAAKEAQAVIEKAAAPAPEERPRTEKDAKAAVDTKLQSATAEQQALIERAVNEGIIKPSTIRGERFRAGIVDATNGLAPQMDSASYEEGHAWALNVMGKAQPTTTEDKHGTQTAQAVETQAQEPQAAGAVSDVQPGTDASSGRDRGAGHEPAGAQGTVGESAAGSVEPGRARDAAGSDVIDAAAHEAATSPKNDLPEPTAAQKEAGNYKKGHVSIQGLDVTIENPVGSKRSGTDPDGKAWETTMQSHYGYIKRTTGADGEHVDAFIGPNPAAYKVFVVDQANPATGAFDEHKVMLGYDSLEEAKAAYLSNYSADWKGKGYKAISTMPMAEFKTWLADGDLTKPVAPVSFKPRTEKEARAQRTEPQPAPAEQAPAPVKTEKDTQAFRAKQIPDMTDEELAAAAKFYGPDHKRTPKIAKEQAKRAKAAQAQPETVEKPTEPADTAKNSTTENDHGNAQRGNQGAGAEPVASPAAEQTAAAGNERTSGDLAGRVAEQVQDAGAGEQAAANAEKPAPVAGEGERTADRPDPAAREREREVADGGSTPETVAAKPANFTITDELDFAGQGAKTKYRNNVAAIRLLKTLEQEKRQATAAEQSVLARYIGWGGMPQAFNENDAKWAKEFAELKELLTEDEYKTALSSTRNAHYTAAPVVSAMWGAVQRLGFTTGAVLEPSLGSGNFFGLMPGAAREQSKLFGVEFDHITGGIAKHLYPRAKVNAPVGFQDIKLAPESFDLAIGNPPFGSEQLYDKAYPALSKFKIHGFFFAKSVASLRPGGVLAMVVSKGLLDANDAQGRAARAYLAENARLLGAIRLPNNAFQSNANTEVTTDIVFLQKLAPGIEPNAAEWNSMGEVTDKETGNPIAINQYFVSHPEMMLGEMTLAGSMYRAGEPALVAREGDNLPALLAEAIGRLPADVMTTGTRSFIEAADAQTKTVNADVREYGHYLENGKLYQRMPDDNGTRQAVEIKRDGRELERVAGMIELRDLVRKQLALEKDANATDKQVEANRAALNQAYDAFQKKNGYLNSPTNKRLFQDDSDAALVLSLEAKYDKGVSQAVAKTSGQKPREAKAEKETIFTKRVQTPLAQVSKVGSAKEAMLASLNERGRMDPAYMEKLYGKSMDEIARELGDLAFEDPQDGWMPRDLYLSGNVKAALQAARMAAAQDARFERNVAALMEVQPADINPSDIFVKIGSPWVDVEDYHEFAKAHFGGRVSGSFAPSIGRWTVDVGAGTQTETYSKYGIERMGAHTILQTLMQNKQVAVYDSVPDGKGGTVQVLNQDQTAAAQGKADELAEAFGEWIWNEQGRRERLARAYNDKFNTNVPRKYDGAHLTLPGMNPTITLRPHQLNWVYRALSQGVGLADHVVGAGKTFAMIASSMEMRRLGLAKKPMIAVPNHLVGQWAKDIMTLYPGANVLAAIRKDFAKDRRKLLFSKIATGDWDMVVVAHSSFGRIPVPAETEHAILQEQMDEIIEAIREAKASKGQRFTVKDLEKAKVRIEEKMKKLADRKQDDLLDFSDLGVDALMVDEAHEFKNLFFTTALQGVAGLGSPTGSTRAFDMFVKTRHVMERTGGRNVFFATGTPLANSIAEVFHMQRFLQYDTLKARGIHQFDAWANTFGQATSDWEMNAAGKFVQKTRFRKFANLPELKGIWNEIADTVTRRDLMSDAEKQGKRFPMPKIATGRAQNIVTERSEQQAEFIGVPQPVLDENGQQKHDEQTGQPLVEFKPDTIVYRLDHWKEASKTNPREIPLAITGAARKAGLDYRLIDDSAPDFEGSKVNAAVSRIVDTWKANDHRKGTQLVFCDLSVPAKHKGQATTAAAAKTPTFFVKNGDGIEHVAGVALTLPAAPDVQFFSFKDGKSYKIYERTSGMSVATGTTKQEAVDAANARLAKMDAKALQKAINDQAIPQDQIDDYLARWDEAQQAKDDAAEDTAEPAQEISLDEMLADGGGNFSVYDDIKKKLIEQGIPAEQIAFIHDYDTDEKKAALFAAMNGGDVRVLLGSTQKMGAGTNVQAKLVALHHMDAPWRPSDLEQREGRIIRQGNEFYEADPDNFEVAIYRYATKQTYDSRMWEIIETKARAIEQFKADASLREIDDVSSESANAAEMKAGASGNPLILTEIGMRTDLRKLEAQKKAWDKSRFDLQRKVAEAEKKTGWPYKRVAFYEQAAAKVQPKDGAVLTVDGKKVADVKKLEAKDVFAKLMQAGAANGGRGAAVAQYRGFTVLAGFGFNTLTLSIEHGGEAVGRTTYAHDDKFSVSGFMTRLDNMVDGVARGLEDAKRSVVAFEKDADLAKDELKRGFPKAADLERLRVEHKAVVAELRAGKTSVDENGGAPLNDLNRAATGPLGRLEEPKRVATLAKLKALQRKLDAGKITPDEFQLGVAQIIDAIQERNDSKMPAARERGQEWIVERLMRARRTEELSREQVDFALWALDKNPGLAADLGISLRSGNGDGVAGNYDPAARIVTLIKGNGNVETAVHEILHHTERMMPSSVQDGIAKAWSRAWMKAWKESDAKVKEALQDMMMGSAGDRAAYHRMLDAFKNGTLNYDAHYQLVNASEFWAVNASRILQGRYNATGSWIAQARQWLGEMLQKVKALFKLPSDAPVLMGLKSVLNSDGARLNGTMLHDKGARELAGAVAAEVKQAPTFNDITRTAQKELAQEFGKPKFTNIDWWDKSVGTQFHKAEKNQHFKKVFDLAVSRENAISLTTIRAAELAPGFLPRIDDFKSALRTLRRGKNASEQHTLAANALIAGTLQGQSVLDGKVWTEGELNMMGLDDQGIALYRQARSAIDASLDEVAAAEGFAALQLIVPRGLRERVIDDPKNANSILREAIDKKIRMDEMKIANMERKGAAKAAIDEAKADLEAAIEARETMEKIFAHVDLLKDAGYAPLMRFGKHFVSVEEVDPTTGKTVINEQTGAPNTIYFGRFETEGEAEAEYFRQQVAHRGDRSVSVKSGPVNDEKYKMYQGVSPETLALFAEVVGAKDAMHKFYQVAVSERSALKRRLERKNIAGFSKDIPRVLANFLTSNGRFAAGRYYTRDINTAIKYIPREKGDVQKEAQRLNEFLANPKDGGAIASSVAFMWFLGGNVASAVINATQPVMMTLPYLSQWGARKAAAALTAATPYAMGKKQIDPDLRAGLKRASQEGKVDAQEIFHLYSVGIQGVAGLLTNKLGKLPVVGGKVKGASENLRARMTALSTLWGMPFAMVEGFNRRLTFIAAWNMAKDAGEADPYAFAVKAVDATQGIYNKVNRPNWARSSVGRVVFTFSQFKIMNVELIKRMATLGGPEGKRAAAMYLAILILAAGVGGLPYADDIDDIIDTVGQWLGYNTNMKRTKREWAYKTLGKTFGDLALYGSSAVLPFDFGGRMGLGNMLPATGLLKPSNEGNRAQEFMELGGPAVGGLGKQLFDAYDAASMGDYGKAAMGLTPTAVKNAAAGLDMAATGKAKDMKGKVKADVTTTDAAAKAIGFNPTVVANKNRANMPIQQDLALQRQVESNIVELWAQGIAQNDKAMMDRAAVKMDDWNRKNPDTPVRITADQIRAKAKTIMTPADTRLLKAAPKEMRARVSAGLDSVN